MGGNVQKGGAVCGGQAENFTVDNSEAHVAAYLTSDRPEVGVDRGVFCKMLSDLNSDPKSAGYLVGNRKDGKTDISGYVSAASSERNDDREVKGRMKGLKDAGYDTVIRVHACHDPSSAFSLNFLQSHSNVLKGFCTPAELDKGKYGQRLGYSKGIGLSYLEGTVHLYGLLSDDKDAFSVLNIFDNDGKRMSVSVHGNVSPSSTRRRR
jgi:hypothetical protein